MAHNDSQSGRKPTPRRISFGRFVVDFDRGRLLSADREIPLHPQTLAVLMFLAERPGQAVPAEQVIEAVWPGLIGSDDLLMQSVGELRRVFGDVDGKLISYDLQQGATLHTSAAPPERRHVRGVQPLRFRWMYGLVAPLVLVAAFAVIWFVTGRGLVSSAYVPPAVAVLPFQDQSDTAYPVDQFTRNIIAALARQPAIAVRGWQDVAVYRGAMAQRGEVARVLAVTYQVEGSVRHANGQVLVTAQLVDIQGRVLWSARYVEPESAAAVLQQRIADDVSHALADDVAKADARGAAGSH